MTVQITQWLLALALLLLVSVLASKVSDRFGVPALLLFLGVGMLAGSEGPGGIEFENAAAAQYLGILALSLILFSGGLETDWGDVRPILHYGLVLATFGVVLTALAVGLVAHFALGFGLLEGLLLGAIVSSTDAAAVFSVLRSKNVHLKGRLKPLLELESGSNDPMAALLTVTLVRFLTQPDLSLPGMAVFFVWQMILGAVAGYGLGRAMVFLVNHIKLGYDGLYPVLTLALVILAYSLTDLVGGNGFLAVYLAGLVMGNQQLLHRRSLMQFHDGVAWLMQIAMFLTLGLLVFPSHLLPILGTGLAAAACLMFLARPLSVLVLLWPTALNLREKLFVSWVGLRGAVPIVLATYPLLAGIPQADLLFNIVFFVVLTSVLVQGMSIPTVARWLHLDAPAAPRRVFPLEYNPDLGLKSDLRELTIPAGSPAIGKSLVALRFPPHLLVVLIARGSDYLIPGGGTTLEEGDTLLVLTDETAYAQAKDRLEEPRDQIAVPT